MFTNYLKIALRTILRQKFYTIINILGLAIGLAVCLLILLFVKDELSYDRYHSNADRIYRVLSEWKQGEDRSVKTPIAEYRLAPALETDFPEFEEVVRLRRVAGRLVSYEEIEFEEDEVYFADKGLLNIFDFELLSGNKESILEEPFTMLLSEAIARKYFGDADPLGQSLRFDDQYDVTVAGLFRDIPDNSHFKADFFISMETGKQVFNQMVLNNWGELSCYTYLLLPEKVLPGGIEERFPAFLEKIVGEGSSENRFLSLQPMLDIHLKSNYYGELATNSDIRYIYIASAIALFIIMIACINYMNLSTARSAKRAKEIGVRKTLGAPRPTLIRQFLTESILLALLAFVLAIGLVALALPAFNGFVGKSLSVNPLVVPQSFLVFLGITILVGLIAGSYPAFYLSSFDAKRIFQEGSRSGSGASLLRKGLVVFQFCISIILIIATLIVFDQWSFLRNKDLGYERENLILAPIPGGASNYLSVKEQLEQNPNIISVAASNKRLTGALSSNLSFKAENFEPDPQSPNSIKIVTIDHDFMKTLQPEFAAGRDFSREYGSDATEGFILNEAAVRLIGWEEPIGKWFETSDLVDGGWVTRRGKVVGVVKDFNMESLYSSIAPVVYFISDSWLNWMTIRVRGSNMSETLSFVKEKWIAYGSEQQFDYTFLDEQIAELYRNEERFFSMFTVFTLLAIFIASLGILGLSSFTAEQRTKEIGIRKVFGASIGNIVRLLLREFTLLVIIGFSNCRSNCLPDHESLAGRFYLSDQYRVLTLRPGGRVGHCSGLGNGGFSIISSGHCQSNLGASE